MSIEPLDKWQKDVAFIADEILREINNDILSTIRECAKHMRVRSYKAKHRGSFKRL